jgi:hypothetical protein
MYEHRSQPVLSRKKFLLRLANHLLVATAILGGSLMIGAMGYHYCAELSWLDAVLNAAMILTGMGPVSPLSTPSAKIFATLYALFSGIVFLAIASVLLAPVFHRLLHRLHFDNGTQ